MTENALTMIFVTTSLLMLQGWVLYMSYKMWQFTWAYSRKWGAAFLVFGVAMILAFLRRIIVIWYLLGWDGPRGALINWADHIGIPIIHTACWIVFLVLLRRWWKVFFERYMKDAKWADALVDREKKMQARSVRAGDRDVRMDIREKAVGKREVAVKKRERKR